MKKIIFFCCLIISSPTFSKIPDYKEKSITTKSKITETVTYSDRVKIIRMSRLKEKLISSKGSWVRLGPLPYTLNKSSVRAKIKNGKYKINRVIIQDSYEKVGIDKSVKKQVNMLEKYYAQKLDLIQQKALKQQKLHFSNNLVFKKPFQKKNQNYVGFGAKTSNLTSAFDLILQLSANSKEEIQKLNSQIDKIDLEINLLNRNLMGITSKGQSWVTYIYVYLKKQNKEDNGSANIQLSYIQNNASWKPSYDLRANLNRKKGIVDINLVTSGLVKQNTGEKWEDIKVTLSSLDPYPLVLPKFTKWSFKETRIEEQEIAQSPGIAGSFMDMKKESIVASNRMLVKKRAKRKAYKAVGKSKKDSQSFALEEKIADMPMAKAESDMASLAPMPSRQRGQRNELNLKRQKMNQQASTIVQFPLQKIEHYFPKLSQIKNKIKNQNLQSRSNVYQGSQPIKYKRNHYNDGLLPAVTSQGRKLELMSPFKLTLESNGNDIKIPLKSQKFTGDIKYLLIPKKDKRAFMKARITNKSNSIILAGNAQVYMDGDLVTKTNLSTIQEGSYFDVDMGVDENIESKRIVKKKSLEEGIAFMKKHSTKVDVELQIVNHNTFPINIEVRDHYPRSPGSKIEIDYIQSNEKPTYHKNGLLYWKKEIKPKQKSNITFSYKVTHPKDYIVSEFN
ncbi:MAG: DUF4139 domain-containing protein [Bacteriovoracaceae bacterium]|nr:DUF4139 domain-containing protein [Bacteriovoracaceae bacterium]